MNRCLWISALCMAAAGRPALAGWTAGTPAGDQEQVSFTTTYWTNPTQEVGSGTGRYSPQVSDTFVPLTWDGSGRLDGATFSGSILDLRPEPPSQGVSYADSGVWAGLTVDVRLFWAASGDPATLFQAFGSGVTVASFQVDNGLTSPYGTSSGPLFSAMLDVGSLPTAGGVGGSYYLGLAGQGEASGQGITSYSVVGDLSDFSIAFPPSPHLSGFLISSAPVPEPSSEALLLLGASATLGLSLRRGLRRRAVD